MSVVKKSMVIEQIRKAQMSELLLNGKRLDERGFFDYRPISIETGIIEKANGSARVCIGNTQIIAGVKIEIGEPFPDLPDKGLLVVNAEVLPLSSAYAEPGPPDESAIELARVVDRGIRESEMIDLSKLMLVRGKKVYAVFIDVNVLNDDGNLFDAVSYAVVSSLITSKIEKINVTQDSNLEPSGEMIPLTINTLPVSITLARLGDFLIVDPNSEEESIMDARITYTINDKDCFCAGQKGQPGTMTIDQVKKAAEIAKNKAREIREIIRRCILKDA